MTEKENRNSDIELPELDSDEILRYARHLTLPEVGTEGQRRLKSARVAVVGAGGLGSPAALYLASAGVGTIGLIDFDRVEESNLQRQIIHGTAAIGRPKVESAQERLADLNPFTHVETFDMRLDSDNALGILQEFDLVVDGSDNFPTRYLLNDACVLLGKPNVYGAVFRFDGQVSVFSSPHGPCYRCLFAEPPPPDLAPSCAEGGVVGVLPGVIGSLQALEALKLILGKGTPLTGRLLILDGLKLQFREIVLRKDPDCPVCGKNPTIQTLIDYEQFCGMESQNKQDEMELAALDLQTEMQQNPDLVIVDVREAPEIQICSIEGSSHIPLGELASRLSELNSKSDLVTVCRTGVRSLQAAWLLKDAGFPRVRSLRGGIHAWSEHVDPSMPRY